MTRTRRRQLLILGALLTSGALAVAGIPYVSVISRGLCTGLLGVVLLWLAWKLLRAFLWKVGRRLAFSYFLIGLLPIPMVLLLLAVVAYLLAGFFQGHLYRDAAFALQRDVKHRAAVAVRELAHTGAVTASPDLRVTYGFYRNGRRIGGDPRLPELWPRWYAELCSSSGFALRESVPPFVTVDGETPALAATETYREFGVVALLQGSLGAELSARSDVWVEISRPGETTDAIRLELGSIPLQVFSPHQSREEARKFFKHRSKGEKLWDDPLLWWRDTATRMVALGSTASPLAPLEVNLNSTPRNLANHLLSPSAEIDSRVWGTFFVVAFLLFDVYAVATLMAGFMIFGLSAAVNRLSRATTAVQQGDFAVRIPVRRRDQLGDLQRSFNQMAVNLEDLVATAGQKEALEKELEIARDVQKRLLPRNLPSGEGVDFSTLFEPSAAIGGDYFDLLRTDDRRLAVIIADVSGHGLSSGLRMAMLKAALMILVQEENEPEMILKRLDQMVRSESDTRFFITATLSLLDFRTGHLEITNAGHPPTYLLRGGDIEEIVLPGSPLGGLGTSYGQLTVPLQPGDTVVWLSDGLIEAPDAQDEPFGYERTVEALRGAAAADLTAEGVRNHLLEAVDRWAGGTPPTDDRTVVVMRFHGLVA
jgi:serine phosphatase RsbU (regulator of sigma subunit)